MELNNLPKDSSNFDQLKKYAKDLSEVYKSEKQKRVELEIKNRQLKKSEAELRKHREHLEELVVERTAELKRTRDQLIQSEKMASLGQLSAGIAHEINNPINFVYTSLNPLRKKLNNLFLLLDKYAEYESNENVDIKKFSRQINLFKRDINFKKTLRNINELLDAIYEGTERTMKIVRDMQQFSRAGDKEIGTVNINKNIDSTLTLLYNQYKEYIEITKEYCDDSEIECNLGQINQVIMNVLVNAIQAVKGQGKIKVKTCKKAGLFYIMISDNGRGIPKENLSRLFDPFFTTKERAKGQGSDFR